MVMASADGKTWADTSFSAATLNAVTWGGNQFVADGDGGGLVTSPDGLKWTIHARLPRGYMSGIAWNGSHYVAVGYGGAILISSDGTNWSVKDSPSKAVNSSVPPPGMPAISFFRGPRVKYASPYFIFFALSKISDSIFTGSSFGR